MSTPERGGWGVIMNWTHSVGTLIGITLLITGIVGVIRGRIDRRWITTSYAALIPLIFGVALLFGSAAPPLAAKGSVAIPFQIPVPASDAYRLVEERAEQEVPPAEDILDDQRELFPLWERQVLKAHAEADRTLSEIGRVMDALNAGLIDRFTAWSRLSVLNQDLKQADLLLHDLVPPSKLNLVDQMRLQDALDDLHISLDLKRASVRKLQEFTRDLNVASLEKANELMDEGQALMIEGLLKMAEVKARLSDS